MRPQPLLLTLLTVQVALLGGCSPGPHPARLPVSAPADSTARRLPGRSEICLTPGDEDGDGLADCEDADCYSSPVCTEICSGGIDEDSDGLVDCMDDDCWSSCGVVVRSHLHGGALDLSWSTTGYYRAYASPYYEGAAVGTLRSLSGSVSLITGTGTVVCGWKLPSATFTTAYTSTWSGSGWGGGPPLDEGAHGAYTATLSSGCAAPLASEVLPPFVSGYAITSGSHWRTPSVQVVAEGQPWYSGQMELVYQKSGHGYGQWSEGHGTLPALNPTTATWSP